ncbi:MAG: fumarate hydratase, partial [Anaerolineae bacterium]|nr:fumarate hydratase [Anaerolineae bacterium]
MREIHCNIITDTVARLCQEANFFLGEDVIKTLEDALAREESPLGKEIISQILENSRVAAQEKLPLCQDTGLAVIFLELGQDVHIIGGNLYEAINEGVRRGY